MFLSPSSPRRIASTVNKPRNPLPQRSASGQEIQVLPASIPTLGSRISLQSTRTPLKSPLNLSTQPRARHGTRITGVTSFAPIHHSRRQAKSVLRLGCHHIYPPQVGRLLQKNKIFGIDLGVNSILSVLDVTPLKTVLLRGTSFLQISPISGRPYLTVFRVPT